MEEWGGGGVAHHRRLYKLMTLCLQAVNNNKANGATSSLFAPLSRGRVTARVITLLCLMLLPVPLEWQHSKSDL